MAANGDGQAALVGALSGVDVPLAELKRPPEAVDYRVATETHKKCGDCSHFNASIQTCDLVTGVINAQHVCNLFSSGIRYRRMAGG